MPLLMCPNCDAAMQAVRRASVEFDMCPQCRGVWLDRGELEKLMAMERGEILSAPPRLPDYERARERRDEARHETQDRSRDGDRYGGRKKRFDLFDIFD